MLHCCTNYYFPFPNQEENVASTNKVTDVYDSVTMLEDSSTMMARQNDKNGQPLIIAYPPMPMGIIKQESGIEDDQNESILAEQVHIRPSKVYLNYT